jgi:hypothetical protein
MLFTGNRLPGMILFTVIEHAVAVLVKVIQDPFLLGAQLISFILGHHIVRRDEKGTD